MPITSGLVSVGSTPTQICAANAGLLLQNLGGQTVTLGGSAVAVGHGPELPAASPSSTPAVPASGVAATNTGSCPQVVVISGGTTVTTVTVNGINVGSGDGTYMVPAYGTIAVTYSAAPTWTWTPIPSVPPVPCPAVNNSAGVDAGIFGIVPSGTSNVVFLAASWGG